MNFKMIYLKYLLTIFGIVSTVSPHILSFRGQRLRVRYPRTDWIVPGVILDLEGMSQCVQVFFRELSPIIYY